MKTLIELDKEDIRQILAEHFKVSQNDIMVEVSRVSVGYGPTEHDENTIKVTIKTKTKIN